MMTRPVSQGKGVLRSSTTAPAIATAATTAISEDFAVQPNNVAQRTPENLRHLAPADILALQRNVGNRVVQRMLARSGEGEAVKQQGVAASGDSSLVTTEIERSIDNARGQGQPLPKKLQRRMEGEFGADFGRVRLHTDKQAHKLSRSLEARAFTTGSDIFFKSGEYNPTGSDGQRLIAHELTHVVQQGNAQRAPTIQRVSDEQLQTGLGKFKYGKVKAAGKLPYFLSLSKQAVEAYKLTENKAFVEELEKLPSEAPSKKKKKAKGGNTPKIEPPKTTAPSKAEPVVSEEEKQKERERLEKIEHEKVQELIASNFEADLSKLLARFDKVDIQNEKDVMTLLDDVVGRAFIDLFNRPMLRRSENLKKVIDKLHGLHVTAWTFEKAKIVERLLSMFKSLQEVIPTMPVFSGDKEFGEKLTTSQTLDTTRKAFIPQQRAAAKDISNPSLKVTSTLTIPGYKLLQWYEEATKTKLSQFYDNASVPAKSNSFSRDMEHLSIAPGNWLNVWAQLKWKDQMVKENASNYGKSNHGQFSLLGDVQAGAHTFNVEDKLWVKEGMGKATRYNVLGDRMDQNKTPQARAKNIREVVSGDFTNATDWEKEAALAMLGSETARNPRSYGVGLMLLDMIEGGGSYGANNKKYTFGKMLGSSPHARESESDWQRRKTGATPAKQNRWANMKQSIDTEAPQFKDKPFKSLWAGKWSMSPSASMSLGTSAIPTDSSKLNTVQYKELKTILNWYINFMKGAELNVKNESEAKTALVKLFSERLGKTGKMGIGSFKEHFDKTA